MTKVEIIPLRWGQLSPIQFHFQLMASVFFIFHSRQPSKLFNDPLKVLLEIGNGKCPSFCPSPKRETFVGESAMETS